MTVHRASLPVLATVLLGAVGIAAGTVAADAATAPAKPARLNAIVVRTAATSVSAGGTVTVSGTLRNSGGRASAAALDFSLRSVKRPRNVVLLGRTVTKAVRARGTRAFRATLTLRAGALPAALRNPYDVVVCVRRSRADTVSRCRSARTIVVVKAAPATAPPRSPPVTTTPTPTTTPTTTTTTTTDTTVTPMAVAGARSAGDNLFPQLGNGGYDATHYDLALSYTPVLHMLSGTSTMTATATARLNEFSMDFQGFTISAVKVNGAAATSTRIGTKLVVTPPTVLETGVPFTVAVTYSGTPPTITDPDGSQEGFLMTSDGAFVVGEPMGSQGWFPNDNHPSDKATFDATMTVPAALTVVGNGVLVSDVTSGPNRTMHWRETHPMATYLATSTIGLFTVTNGTVVPAPGGASIPVYDAVDTALSGDPAIATTLARETEAVTYFSSLWGTYPFSIVGGIVDNDPTVGYALETQTKPIYDRAPDVTTVAHEISHQWWGDSISLTKWQDIWLNEGFADYSEKLFDEREDAGPTLKAQFDANDAKAAGDPLWTIPPAAPPSAADIFAPQVYIRGGMTLEALHEIIGEAKMNELLGDWYAQHRDGNATTAQFIALAQRVSGLNLTAFFQQWLYAVGKPTLDPTNCCS